MMQPTRIRHSRTLIHRQPANFLFYKVFTQENATSFLRKSSSPFSLQELRPLTPLKVTNNFTSLTVIEMMKIMCNSAPRFNRFPLSLGNSMQWRPFLRNEGGLIQVDISGHQPLPTGSKQFSDNFGNLLFLAVFNFRGHFEGLNEGFLGL
jgi:hypothetical protein